MPDSDKIQYADKDSYFSKLSVWLTIIATVAVTVFLIMLGVTENTEVTQIRQENGYTCVEDYHCQEITDDNAPIGVRKEYTFTLDNNIATDTTFMLFLWVFQPFIFEFKLDKSAAEALEQIEEQLTSGWLLIRNN